jgi:hypothetical protein
MGHDINKLKSDIELKTQSNFSNDHYLEQFVQEILQNFSYRYFDQAKVDYNANLKTFTLQSSEKNMKQALKTENQTLRDKIVKHIQAVGLNNAPEVFYQLKISVINQNKTGRMSLKISSLADCLSTFEQAIGQDYQFEYLDFLEFRNSFARHLEQAFSLF